MLLHGLPIWVSADLHRMQEHAVAGLETRTTDLWILPFGVLHPHPLSGQSRASVSHHSHMTQEQSNKGCKDWENNLTDPKSFNSSFPVNFREHKRIFLSCSQAVFCLPAIGCITTGIISDSSVLCLGEEYLSSPGFLYYQAFQHKVDDEEDICLSECFLTLSTESRQFSVWEVFLNIVVSCYTTK